MKTTAVILAAGQGTRMRSALPKVLHPLLGRPMVRYSIDTVQKATGEKPVLVIGHAAEAVRQQVGEAADFVLQEPQLGTGHALQQAERRLRRKANSFPRSAGRRMFVRRRLPRQFIINYGNEVFHGSIAVYESAVHKRGWRSFHAGAKGGN